MLDYASLTARLAPVGIRFLVPPQVHALHAEIALEPPCDVAAEVNLGEKFRIGAFTSLNGGFIKDVSIGRYCSFARDVQIGHGAHPTSWLSVSPLQYNTGNYRNWPEQAAALSGGADRIAPVPFQWWAHTTIGNDVWLGNHVIVKDGVTIGDGAVVGAGSVVTRDVPPYAIVAGSPAKLIRFRFPDRVIERLLALQWWRYKMADFGPTPFADIEGAISHIEACIADGSIRPYEPQVVTVADLE